MSSIRGIALTRAWFVMALCCAWSPRVCPAQAAAHQVEKSSGTRLQAATACLTRGDDECVVRMLAGWARSSEELRLLIETYRKLGQDERAREVMQAYVQRFPDSPRAFAYRRMLDAKAPPVQQPLAAKKDAGSSELSRRPAQLEPKSPLEQATECLRKADDACVVRTLEGKAHNAQELAILCETYLALGESTRARAVMREYLARYPDAPRAAAYRRQLGQN